jgi:hypothetical protein
MYCFGGYFDFRGDWIFFDFGGLSGAMNLHPMHDIPAPFQTSRQEHFGHVERRVDISLVLSAEARSFPQ